MYHVWQLTRVEEGRGWLETALADGSPDPVTRYWLLWSLSFMTCMQGDVAAARRYSEEALAICESRSDSLETSRIIANLGFFERTDGNVEASLALTRRAIDLARETRQPGRRRALAVAIYYLAGSLLAAGELDSGLAAAEESVAMAHDLGNPRVIRMARGVLVDAHWRRRDLEKALALLRLNLAIGPVDPWRHVVDLARMAALLIASEKLNGASGWLAPWKSTVSDLASTWAPLLHPLGKWSRRHSSKGPEQWAGARRASSPPAAGCRWRMRSPSHSRILRPRCPAPESPLARSRWPVWSARASPTLRLQSGCSSRSAPPRVTLRACGNILGVGSRTEVAAWVAENLPIEQPAAERR